MIDPDTLTFFRLIAIVIALFTGGNFALNLSKIGGKKKE